MFTHILGSAGNSSVNARMIAIALDVPVSDVHALTFGTELRPAQATEVALPPAANGGSAAVSSRRHLQRV